MKLLRIETALIAGVISCFFGCSEDGSRGDGGSKEKLTIGYLMPLTGALSEQAEVWEYTALLAQKQINDSGGILGKELILDIRDSQLSEEAAVSHAKASLDGEHAKLILSGEGSGPTIAVLEQVSLVDDVLMLAATASSASLVAMDDKDLFFRTVASTESIGKATARVIADDGYTKLSLLVEQNPYAMDCASAASQHFTDIGHTVAATVEFPANSDSSHDFDDDLATINADNPDSIFLSAYPTSGIAILDAWSVDKTFDVQWYLLEPLRSESLLDNTNEQTTEGMRGIALVGNRAGRDALEEAYLAEYGDTAPDPNIPRMAENYDAVYLMALAIAKAGSTDISAVRTALKEVSSPPGKEIGPNEFAEALDFIKQGTDINYKGASGSVDFDSNGDVIAEMEKWEVQGGKFVTLKTFTP